MNPIGKNSPCNNWSVDIYNYFSSIKLGYTNTYVSYISATTSNGLAYDRGTLGPNDLTITVLFTPESPLIGLNGFLDASGNIVGLGFFKYSCYVEA
jgi:hypothetical protein